MTTWRIRNFTKFQHFKDRKPPWVKLYRELLDDLEWHELDAKSSKVLVMLWLIASESEGLLPDEKKLAFRLRMSPRDVISSCNSLSHWLEQVDDNAISTRYQEARAETETETETDKSAPIGFTPPNWINLQHWQAWHSSPKRKKATNDQKQMAVDKLDAWRQNGEDFAGALENAAVGGYQGLFLPDKKPSQSGATETAYQRSMREKMEVMAPAIAAKAPGVPRTNPNNFFDALPNAKPLEITQ